MWAWSFCVVRSMKLVPATSAPLIDRIREPGESWIVTVPVTPSR
jgi:hypothetical protein